MRSFFAAVGAFFFVISPVFAQPGAQELLYSPDHSVKLALADLKTLPPDIQYTTRYLSLYNIPRNDRIAVAKTVSFVVNSLSTRRKPYVPSFVPNSDFTLIRLNLDDYDWDRKTWEKLGKEGSGPKPFPEPYFHYFIEEQDVEVIITPNFVEVIVETAPIYVGERQVGTVKQGDQFTISQTQGEWYSITTADGTAGWLSKRNCKAVQRTRNTGSRRRRFAQAPWLEASSVIDLVKLTQSECPIYRADWFICNAILPPTYHEFLKLGKNFKDFEKLVFADVNRAENARLQDKGIVIHSSVARNNRTLIRSNALTNYIWISHDTLRSVDKRKYAQIILNEEFDASEIIGSLPNGLQAYFLTDGKGSRTDFADPNIAIDSTAADKIVRTGRSCMICHSDGIRPIDDEIRSITKMLQDKEQVQLLASKKGDYYKVADLFGSDLSQVVVRDQQSYQNAVNAVTGLDMRVNAANLARIYDGYAETLLTKENVVRECGIPFNELETLIRLSTDNVVAGLIKSPVRAVRRDQWEESFGQFMLLAAGIKKAQQGAPPPAPARKD